MGDKVKLNNLIKKIEVIKKIEKINEVTKELIKNQWFLSVVFLVLAILTIFSTLFGNIMYTIFNPLLFGTSVGKIGVLFLWLGICFLPFKLISKFIEKIKFDRIKFDRIKNDRIKIRIILFSVFMIFIILIAWISLQLAYELREKFLGVSGLPILRNEIEIIIRVYGNTQPIFYDSTQMHHSHLLKSAFCFLPVKGLGYDVCGPITALVNNLEHSSLINFVLPSIIIICIFGLLFIISFEENIEKFKWGILIFGLTIASIDGGAMTPQWILFFGMCVLYFLGDFFGSYLILLTPIVLGIRNAIISAYIPLNLQIKLLFYVLPILFFIFSIKPKNKEDRNKKNRNSDKKFVLCLIIGLCLISYIDFIGMEPLTPETSIAFYGEAKNFSFPHEYVAHDGDVHVIRFYTNQSWEVYNSLYSDRRSYSYKSFLYKLERCIGVKLNIAYFILPENKTIESNVIRITNLKTTNKGATQVSYICACSDCNLIPSIEGRKSIGEEYIIQINYIMLNAKSPRQAFIDFLLLPT